MGQEVGMGAECQTKTVWMLIYFNGGSLLCSRCRESLGSGRSATTTYQVLYTNGDCQFDRLRDATSARCPFASPDTMHQASLNRWEVPWGRHVVAAPSFSSQKQGSFEVSGTHGLQDVWCP